MSFEFSALIKNGGGKGTGLIELPKNFNSAVGTQLEVTILSDKTIRYFSKVKNKRCKNILYIPKDIMQKSNFRNNTKLVKIKKIVGNHIKMSKDGRVYLPLDLIKDLRIKNNDIVNLKIVEEGTTICKKCLVHYRCKNDAKEYFCWTNVKSPTSFVSDVTKLKKLSKSEIPSLLRDWLKNKECVSSSAVISVLTKHKVSIEINPKLNLSELAYFLGAYFADGTKKGNSWAICASCIEQANYYYAMHNRIIKSPNLNYYISLTTNKPSYRLKKLILKKWQNNLGFKLDEVPVRLHKSHVSKAPNRNKYGTLVFREYKVLVLELYNFLLKKLIERIIRGDKNLGIDFLCGVLEGDGSLNAKKRAHLHIATNTIDMKILHKVFEATLLKASFIYENNNRCYIRIGALEILKNFEKLKGRLFTYYPKRRKILFDRLKKIGCVKYMYGNQKYASSKVKAELKKLGVLNNKYKLTRKGQNMVDYLKNVSV